jgi:hypothetical protein
MLGKAMEALPGDELAMTMERNERKDLPRYNQCRNREKVVGCTAGNKSTPPLDLVESPGEDERLAGVASNRCWKYAVVDKRSFLWTWNSCCEGPTRTRITSAPRCLSGRWC